MGFNSAFKGLNIWKPVRTDILTAKLNKPQHKLEGLGSIPGKSNRNFQKNERQ